MPRLLVLSIAFLVLTGCAAQRAFDEGRELIDAGKIPEGLARIDEAYRLDPRNQSYREQYIKQRDFAVQRYLTLAEKARISNLFDEAQAAYQQALVLDSANPRASAGLESLRVERRHRALRPDLRTTLFVRNTSIEDVIRFILVTNQLERKVLNENTLLVYPNTPAKAKDYQELMMRSFYLANADVKQISNMVKALVKTKDMYVDEKLNVLVIRDTPEAVRVVERLIANQDLAEPEVMLEVEVLEVATSLLTQLGIRWPTQASAGVAGAGGGGALTLPELRSRD